MIALALLAACTPHSAAIDDGEMTAFLAVSTSQNIFNDTLNLDDFDDHWQLDCRSDVPESELLPDRISGCNDIDNVDYETWLGFDGYEIVQQKLDPWRGEAIMTSEGDLQITFHQHVPGSELRFAFVVDPGFQPKVCNTNAEGQPELDDVDGNWLQNWTAGDGSTDPEAQGFDSGTLFYLNAGAYQFDPSDLTKVWILPNEWLAGYTQAKLGDEDFFLRSVRYGKPFAYAEHEIDDTTQPRASDLFYVQMPAGSDPTANQDFLDQVALMKQIAVDSQNEMNLAGYDDFHPRVETNAWRTPDAVEAGLDGWGELDYNWVHFDQDAADLSVGNPATGEFHLTYQANGAQSKLFINGTFTVDKIKKDHWTVPDLEHDKQIDNGTVLCGTPVTE